MDPAVRNPPDGKPEMAICIYPALQRALDMLAVRFVFYEVCGVGRVRWPCFDAKRCSFALHPHSRYYGPPILRCACRIGCQHFSEAFRHDNNKYFLCGGHRYDWMAHLASEHHIDRRYGWQCESKLIVAVHDG